MGHKPKIAIGLEFDEKGNFRLVMAQAVFEAVRQAIESGNYEELDEDRVAMVVGSREGVELTSFFAMGDLPPCPTPKPPPKDR